MLIGSALIIPGLAIRALASGHVRKNEQLTTTGPYAHTRNPLYLGSLILAVGFAITARNWWIGVGVILIFLAIYLPVIRGEEAFLENISRNLRSTRAESPGCCLDWVFSTAGAEHFPGTCTGSIASTMRL